MSQQNTRNETRPKHILLPPHNNPTTNKSIVAFRAGVEWQRSAVMLALPALRRAHNLSYTTPCCSIWTVLQARSVGTKAPQRPPDGSLLLRRFTEAEDALVVQRMTEGMSRAETARPLGRSRAAVMYRVRSHLVKQYPDLPVKH